jgi:membrane protein
MRAQEKLRNLWRLLKEAATWWMKDNSFQHGAAVAFYTIFAISPMFLIVTSIAGLIFGEEAAHGGVFRELSKLIGPESAEALRLVIAESDRPKAGVFATVIAGVTLLIGATTVVVQLQTSLNFLWKVKPRPGRVIRGFIRNRLLSFALVLAVGFLVLVSLLLSAALSALGTYFSGMVPGFDALWQLAAAVAAFVITAALFAMIFKYLPDIRIQWREVAVGALVTAALFTGGKFLIGFYLGRSAVASTYGAAGSLVVVLLWVYYSSLILFYGAEITRAHARRSGANVEPAPYADWIERANGPASERKP